MVDLGHWNDAPADPHFFGLAQLLTWDGYRVTRSKQELVPELLRDTNLLILDNAMPYPALFRRFAAGSGGQRSDGWSMLGLGSRADAFTAGEGAAVRDWVRGGGALFLEASVPGAGRAAGAVAGALGVTFHDCRAGPWGASYGILIPAAEVGEDAITAGRQGVNEQVLRVAVLAGGWVEGPGSEAIPILKAPAGGADGCLEDKPLAVAFRFGRGRVVALSAQLERDEGVVRSTGADPRWADNRQLALNMMHWLSGLTDEGITPASWEPDFRPHR